MKTAKEILDAQINDWPFPNERMMWPGDLVLKMINEGIQSGLNESLSIISKQALHLHKNGLKSEATHLNIAHLNILTKTKAVK